MSSSAHANAHHDDGAVHAHISPIGLYIAVFFGLLLLTLATVGQSYVNLGELNVIFVILIATMKASLVLTFFMHLKWDDKFHALIVLGSLVFIGVFFVYTMNDTNHRGASDPDQNVKVLQRTGEEAPGGGPASIPTGAKMLRGLESGLPDTAASAAPEHH